MPPNLSALFTHGEQSSAQAQSLHCERVENLRLRLQVIGSDSPASSTTYAYSKNDSYSNATFCLTRLWAAPTTSYKERKRLLRTLIRNLTLISVTGSMQLRIGIRRKWRQRGAPNNQDELTTIPRRPPARTPSPAPVVTCYVIRQPPARLPTRLFL